MRTTILDLVVESEVMKPKKSMAIGRNLARLRKARGWTQEELGKRIGMPAVSIRRYELDRYSPNAEALAKLAKALGSSIDEIVFGEAEGLAKASLKDSELLRQFEELQSMDDVDRDAIKHVTEGLITAHKLKLILPSRGDGKTRSLQRSGRTEVRQFLERVVQTIENPERRGPRAH